MGVDKAVPGKLWDGPIWHWPVMDKAKAFTVESPWFWLRCRGAHPRNLQSHPQRRLLSAGAFR
eukprot:8411673-Pyramimonas_sp.AAC.1